MNGKENSKIRVNTVTSLMPILLEDLEKRKFERILGHILDPREYWAQFPIPSVAMDHPSFRPDTVGGNLVWRGPVGCVAIGIWRAGWYAMGDEI